MLKTLKLFGLNFFKSKIYYQRTPCERVCLILDQDFRCYGIPNHFFPNVIELDIFASKKIKKKLTKCPTKRCQTTD